ncbi:unnamed protein product [Paramecium sonneborni]|uniref:Uncharacterized protein n=1 Tax=Paramecium sonneborni TaxID=65129 RepID=A0A8S1PKP8_9CILI|nr:unnamed protein product [Paramecium sonneborni]
MELGIYSPNSQNNTNQIVEVLSLLLFDVNLYDIEFKDIKFKTVQTNRDIAQLKLLQQEWLPINYTEQLYTSILNSYTSSLLAEIEIKFPTGRKEKYLIGAQIYQTRLMKTKYKNKFKLQIIVHQFFQTQIAFYIMTIGSDCRIHY